MSFAPPSSPYESPQARRFVVHDFEVEVGPAAVLPLTMSLNELCTNAVKYGALSNPAGRIEIASRVDEKTQRFALSWTERAARRCSRRPGAASGRASSPASPTSSSVMPELEYEPAGLCYELDVPLSALRATRPDPRLSRPLQPTSVRAGRERVPAGGSRGVRPDRDGELPPQCACGAVPCNWALSSSGVATADSFVQMSLNRTLPSWR